MNTTSILIKTEPKIKQEAQKTAKELGLNLSTVLNTLLKQFIQTKTITLETKELDEVPNANTSALLKKAQKDRLAGKGSPLFTDNEKLIKKNPKKYQHINTMSQWLHEQGV